MFNLFNFTIKVKSSLDREDLTLSRYFSIYDYHSKKIFKKELEKRTLEKTNEIISHIFPKRIYKNAKKEIIDGIVIFLKFMSANHSHIDEDIFEIEFNRIVESNLKKINEEN